MSAFCSLEYSGRLSRLVSSKSFCKVFLALGAGEETFGIGSMILLASPFTMGKTSHLPSAEGARHWWLWAPVEVPGHKEMSHWHFKILCHFFQDYHCKQCFLCPELCVCYQNELCLVYFVHIQKYVIFNILIRNFIVKVSKAGIWKYS